MEQKDILPRRTPRINSPNRQPVNAFKFLNALDEAVFVKWHPTEGPVSDCTPRGAEPGHIWNTFGGKTTSDDCFGIYRSDGSLMCNFSPTENGTVVLVDGTTRDECF